MKFLLILVFLSSVLFAKELPLHRIWIEPDGAIVEGNYPDSLLSDTTAQTKLNMDAYDKKHRPQLIGFESRDYAVDQLKNLLPSKAKRHRWRWDASKDRVYIDMTLPKNSDEKMADYYAVLASTASTRPEKREALLDIEIMKATQRMK